MFLIKKVVIFILLIIVVGCASNDINKINSNDKKYISIDTPNDKYNILFKEYLRRKFYSRKYFNANYVLKTNISFTSNKTLSVSGSSVLNSTKAIVKYSLLDNANLLVETGTIETFPALSSSSNSLYSNEKSLSHVKERLSQSSANKLYILINIIVRKLIEN